MNYFLDVNIFFQNIKEKGEGEEQEKMNDEYDITDFIVVFLRHSLAFLW